MSETDIKKKFSDSMYILKALSMLSVVCAHSGVAACRNQMLAQFLYNFSTVGVCIFFLLSGYFFHAKMSFGKFAKKKVISLCVPWLFAATLTYALRFVRSDIYCNIPEYISYVLGNGSLYYYLTVIIIFYCVYYCLGKYESVLYTSIALSTASIFLTAFEIIDVYPYLNPFNWCGFFAAGVLLQKAPLEKISLRTHAIIAISTGVVWSLLTMLGMNAGYYWFKFSLFNEILLICALFSLSVLICEMPFVKGIMTELGKLTLPIYLYHLPIVWQMPGGNSVFITFIRIFGTVGICFAAFFALKKMARGFLKKTIEVLIGIK